ncbi:MAG: hypothetical protein WB630_09110 [Candidatus Acidiferrales bacterium]
MVFAVAALLLQLQAFAPPVQGLSVTPATALNTRLGSATTDAITSVPPDMTADSITWTTESSSVRMNLESVHLDNEISKAHTPATLATVALETPQNSQSFLTVRIPTESPKGYSIKEAMSLPSRREWLALSIVEHGAAAFDAYSTRQAIGHGAVEDDPLMRPFAHSPAIYAATQVGPVVFDLLARHMQRSEYPVVRRVWWMPQTISAGLSIFSGAHNLHVAGKR